jgi:phage shock protein C
MKAKRQNTKNVLCLFGARREKGNSRSGQNIEYTSTIERGIFMPEKKLYRSPQNRMISGVCAGIGEYFNVDPTIVRLAWVIFSLPMAGLGGLVAYIAAAYIIPEAPVGE